MDWLKAHWWLVGAIGLVAGTLWWIIAGGLAPLAQSIEAMTRPEIARSIEAFPKVHEDLADARQERAVLRADLDRAEAARQADTDAARAERERIMIALQDIADDIARMEAEDLQVVVWAEARTLELNEGLTCIEGEVCSIWFRGRRTPEGIECRTLSATPYFMESGDGRGIPARMAEGWQPINLTLRYRDFMIEVIVPRRMVGNAPERRYIVSVALYGDCDFVEDGEVIERPTMRVPVTIVPAEG